MSIRKPETDELQAALAAADRMREEGSDPHHIAMSLHYLQHRCQALEDLLQATDRYLRFGLPEHELSQMRILVDRLREQELSAGDSDQVDGTLPI